MQPLFRTFEQPHPQKTLTPPSVIQSRYQLQLKMIISTKQQPVVSPLTPPVQLTSRHLFVTPVIHPTYGHTAPITLCWGGPPHPTPTAPAAENASMIEGISSNGTNGMVN